tara:strand:+ start:482 stop:835 length:354 start_codon:yes stop_codon:yes gene_type:complete
MSFIPQSRADLATATPFAVTADHTTSGTEILRCSADVTVVLNQTPKDRETVMVKLTTSNTVKIVGDINITSSSTLYNVAEYNTAGDEFGGTTVTLSTADTTAIFTYVRKFGEWFPYN